MTPHLADTPVLDTERLTLRAPQASDFEAIAPFVMSDRAVYVGGGADSDIGNAWRALSNLTGHWALREFGVFVCTRKDTGRVIGSMGPWFPAGWPEPELSWTIWDEAAEGKGYAFEAMIRVRRHVYADLGWTTTVSYIDPANTRSLTLAERLGCVLDKDAKCPHPDEPVQVWRHPAPAEVLA